MSGDEYILLGLEGPDQTKAVRSAVVEIVSALPLVSCLALPSKIAEKFEAIRNQNEVAEKLRTLEEAIEAISLRIDSIESRPVYRTLLKLHEDNLLASSEEISKIVTGLMDALAKNIISWDEAELLRSVLKRLTPLEINVLSAVARFDPSRTNLLNGPILDESFVNHVKGSQFICALLSQEVTEQREMFIEHAAKTLENEGLVCDGFTDMVRGADAYHSLISKITCVEKLGKLIVSFLHNFD